MNTHYQELDQEVADDYVAELRRTQNALVANPEDVAARRRSALAVTRDVLAELSGQPASGPASHEIRASMTELARDSAKMSAAVVASPTLFACALRVLAGRTDFTAEHIAVALNRRLWQDVLTATDAGMPQQSSVLAIDTRQLPVRLTRGQMRVLGPLVSTLSIEEIADQLHISTKTVENYIGHIGDKLGGRGRRGIRAALIATQALIAVPVVIFGAQLSDGLMSLQDMF